MKSVKSIKLGALCIIAYIIFPHSLLQAQRMDETYGGINQMEAFVYYLNQFPLLSDLDTILRPIGVFPKIGESKHILNDTNSEYINFVPFFKTYPIFKAYYNWGILVCIHRAYSNEFTNLDYLEMISYDDRGNQLSQTTIPYFLLESTPCQGDSSEFYTLCGDLFISDSILLINYVEINNRREFSYPPSKFLISKEGLKPVK